MKDIDKQNTDQENSDSLLNERQDEARNERSECSCPQSFGSPPHRPIPDGYKLSHAPLDEDKAVCEFLWNATGNEDLLESIS